MGKTAIIGHTGFVGGNLVNQTQFDDTYNSKNIGELAGKEYDLLVCSGARAEKWRINQEPEVDAAELQTLKDALAGAKIKELILISTVDVYPAPVIDVDEDTVIDPSTNHPYGAHRFELEEFVRGHFDNVRVVRLPGLFGPGLKKNIIFDFMHDNNLEMINADGVFQFYDLNHLWHDINVMREADLRLVNIATEPVSVAEVAREVFDREFDNRPEGQTAARYDMKSKHAEAFGGHDGYLYDKAAVLTDMKAFVAAEPK